MSHQYNLAPTRTLTRRRNGRQQACEPCSRRKVACDHRLPVCSRCKKSRISEKCVYLPEKRGSTSQPSPSPSAIRNAHPNGLHPSQTPLGIDGVPTPVPVPVTVPVNSSTGLDGRDLRSPSNGTVSTGRLGNSGYLGATSFSAVLQEAQNSLSSAQNVTPNSGEASPVGSYKPHPKTALDKQTFDMAMSIIRKIPDRESSYAMFRYYSNPNRGWCHLAAVWLLDSLWNTYDSALESQKSSSLAKMAETIGHNTLQPWAETEIDPKEWFGMFSGPNMRWEALAILFVYWACGAKAFPRYIPIQGSLLAEADRMALCAQYKECAWRCTELARRSKSCNSIVVWVLLKHSMIESLISGDAGVENWRYHAEVVALSTYLGMHVSSAPANDRSVSVQIKRRVFAAVYRSDKVSATFTGRPPLLGTKYCTTPLPLDMSDEELMGLVPPAPENLDEFGWNKVGALYLTTVTRARAEIARVGDGILEVALQSSVESTEQRLLDLRQREMEAVSRFPFSIVYQDGDENDPNIDDPALYSKLLVKLEHMQNLFLIDRLLYRQGLEPINNLIEVSFEMVSVTLVFWTHQDKLEFLNDDLEWLAMQYAAPGGGILCMELLRPRAVLSSSATPSSAATGGRPDNSNTTTTTTIANSAAKPLSMTRSDIVQRLSLLVSFLNWVQPTAPNGELCGEVKKVIRHALDEALNTPAGATKMGSSTHVADAVASWDMDFSADWNDFFSLDLLDTFDWLRPEAENHMVA